MNAIAEPAPGITLITLPLPFELEHVHVALVRLQEGYLLIDGGIGSDASFAVLSQALEHIGVAWSAIRIVLASHIHPDHSGGLPCILAESGALLLMHREEYDYLGAILAGDTPWIDAAFTEAAVPRERWEAIRSSLLGMRRSLPQLRPDHFISDGESLATARGPATILATPGHSPGHVCLYWPGQRVLYSGDHMIAKITPNIAWMPGQDMLGRYLDSLQRIERLDVDLVIAAHGEPFANAREWIAATRRHHRQRCDRIYARLLKSSASAYELVPVVWDRDFSEFHLYFAVFEVLAHLEHMQRSGRIECEVKERGARQWRARASGLQPSALTVANDYGV